MNAAVHKKRNNIYAKIVGFFLVLTIVAIVIIVHFALAKVTIKLYSHPENIQDKVLVEMQPESQGQASDEEILGKILTSQMEITTATTSTQETIQSDKAGGFVTIYNNYSRDQVLINTTRLLTPDNKLFRITKRVEIPSGGQAEVWAEADQAGEQFATGPTTFIIPGLWEGLQDKIYAESKDGMTLESRPTYLVSQADLDNLQAQARAGAIQEALDKFNAILPAKLAVNESQLLVESKTIESSQVGANDPRTSLKQQFTVYGIIFDPASLIKTAETKLNKDLDSEQSLLNIDYDNISYQIVEAAPDQEHAVLEVTIPATVSSTQKAIAVDKNALVGLDETGVRQYFQNLDIEELEIKFSPFWVTTVPKIKDHIIIE